jgi:hypothetical protein
MLAEFRPPPAGRRALLAGLAAALLARAPAAANAGAWMLARGSGQAITTFSAYRSTGGYDDRGNPVPGAKYERLELDTYLEYGLTNAITIGAQPRYQWAWSGSGASRQSSSGWSDIDLFVRRRLWDVHGWVSSVQALAVLPDAYDPHKSPAPGTGRAAYEARLLAGRNLGAHNWGYLDVETAYRVGTSGLSDQIRGDITLGLKPRADWLAIAEFTSTISTTLGDGTAGASYDLSKLRLSVVRNLTQTASVELGYWRDVAGRRVGLGNSIFLSCWLRF